MKTNNPISPPSGPVTGSFNGLHPESKFLAMGLAAVLAGTAFAGSAVTSYEYVAPTSYAYADPNAVNLQSQSLAADLPAAPPEQIAAPPALPEHVSASIVGGSEVGGGSEVVFLGDAGNANHVVFSVDAQGRLQHNLGSRFGLASDLDLDAAAPGVQTLTIGQITRLTYRDLDAVADDSVTIDAVTDDSVTDDAGGLDLGGGSLAISAGTVTIHGSVHAAQVELSAHLLDNSGAVSSSGSVGGRIAIVADQVLNSGLIAADGTAGAGGEISLTLAQRLMQAASGVISASGQGGSGGRVTILAGDGAGADGTVIGGMFLSGTIRADGSGAGAIGGAITIAGGQLDLYGATVQAEGAAGGGRIHVGWLSEPSSPAHTALESHATTNITINPATVLSADAVQAGSGGQVIVWSEGRTTVAGRLTAQGGAAGGDGGAVEASGLAGLVWQGLVDVTAPAGRAGSVLFDPKNITVSNPALDEFVDPHPASANKFGTTIAPLNTGNVVITSPYDDAGATDAGAVYLFNGSTGALISTLTGSTKDDRVGLSGTGTGGDVAALSNGNFVVCSSNWNVYRGAATWGSGTTGVSGTVSSSNSLIGSTSGAAAGDKVGSSNLSNVRGVVELSNGNYVVRSGAWSGKKGAVTWGSGTAGVTGTVSSSNSLVGVTNNDQVGGSGVQALSSGNYVVSSYYWSSGRGAVTWGSGTTGVSGTVSSTNSLVGTTANDQVGTGGVTILSNGNYVVRAFNWDNGSTTNVGAVTWVDGTKGLTGAVSSSNSLIGTTGGAGTGDIVGSGGVTALSNGNYVVISPSWNSYKGAVTWVDGTTGLIGTVSDTNSLVGSTGGTSITGDGVGGKGVTALSNGNYVVSSPSWDNGSTTNAGAVTWVNGTTGLTGAVSSSNSLVGSTASDQVGFGSVTVLSSGDYVVRSPYWYSYRGAATWVDGTTGLIGTVSNSNSLVGTSPGINILTGDQVGSVSVMALSNGNYVVSSPKWDNGGTADVGAVTWVNATTGLTGAVSSSNSLVGSTANDQVGTGGVTILSNGNYVVRSTQWSTYQGAATWGSGTAGVTGEVSSSNSLVGSSPGTNVTGDQVGYSGVVELRNGNYVVCSQTWHNVGAVTWGSGTTGVSGVLSSSNSLVGTNGGDFVGMGGVTALSNGNYVVKTQFWANGGATSAGAATWGSGTTGVSGAISSSNSLVGLTSSAGLLPVAADDVNGTFLAPFAGEAGTTPGGGTYGGRVRVGSQSSGVLSSQPFGSQTFADQADQSLLLTADVDSTLNTGAAVTLQVNNDLTVTSPITADNPSGSGGNLTLQAGRSLLLNANITTDNGNLTLTGNDLVANGVVDANRDSGNAEITMAAGTDLNVGTGTLTVALRDSADKTYNAHGVATLQDVTAASTVLNDGTILANGIWTSPVMVNGEATLGGTGTVGALTVAANGTVAPGNSSGILNSAAVTLSAGANFDVELNGTAVGTQYDQLNVTGKVTIDGANLNVTLGYTTTIGDSFVIIANDGTGPVMLTDPLKVGGTPLLEGGSFTVSGQRFVLTYAGGTDSNDVVLTREDASKATPTVSTWPTASAITTVGQALSVSSLSGGSASVAGSFAWTAPATTPPAGNYSAAVTFTPTDTTNYNTVAGSVNVLVGLAAVADTVTRSAQGVTKIAVAQLLANDLDAAGRTLSISSVTAGSGGTVALSGRWITFTPEAGLPDGTPATFTYVLSNGTASTAAATVTLTAPGTSYTENPATLLQGGVMDNPGGGKILTFAAIPGFVYQVEASSDVGDPDGWTPLGSFTAGADGRLVITDPGATTPSRFYRFKK